ncbi:GM13347 [Drosophila sechellia]|uniref:GM13347 n=1 Tax=Drosophila sechellia TaxID=7238 RepID=B4IEW2_DROSE|nr:GM13347 [Drosophila sechellia]
MPATPPSLTSCKRMARSAPRFVAVPLAAVVLLMLVPCIPHEHNNVIKMQFAAIYFEHKASKMLKSSSELEFAAVDGDCDVDVDVDVNEDEYEYETGIPTRN